MSVPTLKNKYDKQIRPQLKKKFDYSSIMQVPKLVKIVINQGVGSAISNPKMLETAIQELTMITGQKAIATKAKKSISNFKLRAGMAIGAKVTLRRERMYEFLERLTTLALVRKSGFAGINPKGFDKQGNYTLGIKEQIIFPEISMDKINKLTGINITFVTSSKDKKVSYALLHALGLPFTNMHQYS